jgi:hypothetical protein
MKKNRYSKPKGKEVPSRRKLAQLMDRQEREIKFSTRDLMCEAYGYGLGSILGASSLLEIAQDLERCGGAGVTWLREKSDDEVLVFLCRWRGVMRRNLV